jgi:hypothetical protein
VHAGVLDGYGEMVFIALEAGEVTEGMKIAPLAIKHAGIAL